jgi:ribosomal protein S1
MRYNDPRLKHSAHVDLDAALANGQVVYGFVVGVEKDRGADIDPNMRRFYVAFNGALCAVLLGSEAGKAIAGAMYNPARVWTIVGKEVAVVVTGREPDTGLYVVSRRTAQETGGDLRENLVLGRNEWTATIGVTGDLVRGAVCYGSVREVTDSYAVLDMGNGIDGHLDVADYNGSFVKDLPSVVALNDLLLVRVVSVESPGKVYVSRKDALDPWGDCDRLLRKHMVVVGKVATVRGDLVYVTLPMIDADVMCDTHALFAVDGDQVGKDVLLELWHVNGAEHKLRGSIRSVRGKRRTQTLQPAPADVAE